MQHLIETLLVIGFFYHLYMTPCHISLWSYADRRSISSRFHHAIQVEDLTLLWFRSSVKESLKWSKEKESTAKKKRVHG